MQNTDGKDAGGMVSSEFAAMMDLIILPKLRTLYGTTQAELDAACRGFAAQVF